MAFKLLSSKLPNELVDKIAKQLHFSFMKDLKEDIKRVNVWKRPTKYLVDIIDSSGTFQVGHYDNKHLEIYEYNGYIRGRLRSPESNSSFGKYAFKPVTISEAAS